MCHESVLRKPLHFARNFLFLPRLQAWKSGHVLAGSQDLLALHDGEQRLEWVGGLPSLGPGLCALNNFDFLMAHFFWCPGFVELGFLDCFVASCLPRSQRSGDRGSL